MGLLHPWLKHTLTRRRSRSPVRPLLIIGHRGAAGAAPENTATAFELALDQGADGIEFDVHLSADGVPVVIHDPWLRRTTSGKGWVRMHTVAGLERLDAGSWFNRRYPARARSRYVGLRIPRLSEVLALVRDRQCLAFVEIKHGGDLYPGIEEKVLTEIHYSGTQALVTLISFDLPTLRRVRRIDSEISLGIDFTRPVLAFRQAESIAATTLLPYWAFAARRFIGRAHRAGLRVLVWGLDRPHWMERKLVDGVDGIITRYPAKLAAIRTRLGPGQTSRVQEAKLSLCR